MQDTTTPYPSEASDASEESADSTLGNPIMFLLQGTHARDIQIHSLKRLIGELFSELTLQKTKVLHLELLLMKIAEKKALGPCK
jgi:hypothetical protein